MREAALQFGAPLLLAAVSTFLGGYITERATARFDGLGSGSGYRHGGACLRNGLFRRGSDMGFRALG